MIVWARVNSKLVRSFRDLLEAFFAVCEGPVEQIPAVPVQQVEDVINDRAA